MPRREGMSLIGSGNGSKSKKGQHMAKTYSKEEKDVLAKQAEFLKPYANMGSAARHAAAVADIAVRLGLPADRRDAFFGLIAKNTFAGNASGWEQTYARAFAVARPTKRLTPSGVDAALALLEEPEEEQEAPSAAPAGEAPKNE